MMYDEASYDKYDKYDMYDKILYDTFMYDKM
jgi:hypothetical protein